MYTLKLLKQIHAGISSISTDDVFLERTITLPFKPFPGLLVEDKEFQIRIGETIAWDMQEEVFRYYTDSDKEIYNAYFARKSHRSIEEIVAEYLQQGWVVRGETC